MEQKDPKTLQNKCVSKFQPILTFNADALTKQKETEAKH
jgi:hypothetical protein